ncbi:MAG: DUF2760 domain-containing protein [Proteobacteria bacterium]|nr:DUF2760 domain-containing protein [Desulfobacula sp.]MBU4129815.1 DUF2760 domain-containing protein [Pseudomonadota bacterium]
MEISKIYRKKSFWIITLIMVLLAAGVSAGIYFGGKSLVSTFSYDEGQKLLAQKILDGIVLLDIVSDRFYLWAIPITMGAFLLFGWVLWLILGFSMAGVFNQVDESSKTKSESKFKKKDFVDHKLEQERKRRLFLHSLSILQREGRLLDFFDEDLTLYEDEQIGAAVRSVQEDCKKAIKKYIDPKPIIGAEEGESVTIEPGFDVDAITLVGNVAGQPPFQGILKHRGWQAGKQDVPRLSDILDSGILAPAEIEIP